MDSPLADVKNLVIVCGHAVCTHPRYAYHEESWLLQPFQGSNVSTQKPSEHHTFMQHISAGLCRLADPTTLVIFSGGKTWQNCDIAEAQSYMRITTNVQDLLGLYYCQGDDRQRVRTESYATDSYQNLLFSIIAFYDRTSRWPEMITVITHAFKQDRFLYCHSDALRWPREMIRVQGINPPFSAEEMLDVTESEAGCRQQWVEDPYGVKEPLAGKRRQRRWGEHAAEYLDNISGFPDEVVVAQLQALLEWTGGESGKEIFPYALPWDPVS